MSGVHTKVGQAAVLLIAASRAVAAEPNLALEFSWGYFGKLGIALIAVLVLFVFFAWLMRRYQQFGHSQNDGLAIVASLSIGTRERLVLVKVGEKQVLLGVTSTQINPLTVLEVPLESSENNIDQSFKAKLNQLLPKDKGLV